MVAARLSILDSGPKGGQRAGFHSCQINDVAFPAAISSLRGAAAQAAPESLERFIKNLSRISS